MWYNYTEEEVLNSRTTAYTYILGSIISILTNSHCILETLVVSVRWLFLTFFLVYGIIVR